MGRSDLSPQNEANHHRQTCQASARVPRRPREEEAVLLAPPRAHTCHNTYGPLYLCSLEAVKPLSGQLWSLKRLHQVRPGPAVAVLCLTPSGGRIGSAKQKETTAPYFSLQGWSGSSSVRSSSPLSRNSSPQVSAVKESCRCSEPSGRKAKKEEQEKCRSSRRGLPLTQELSRWCLVQWKSSCFKPNNCKFLAHKLARTQHTLRHFQCCT